MSQKLMVAILSDKDAAAVRDSGCTVLAEYPNARLVRATKGQEGKLASRPRLLARRRPVDRGVWDAVHQGGRARADEASPATVDQDRAAYPW